MNTALAAKISIRAWDFALDNNDYSILSNKTWLRMSIEAPSYSLSKPDLRQSVLLCSV